jgi:hypothetical protein
MQNTPSVSVSASLSCLSPQDISQNNSSSVFSEASYDGDEPSSDESEHDTKESVSLAKQQAARKLLSLDCRRGQASISDEGARQMKLGMEANRIITQGERATAQRDELLAMSRSDAFPNSSQIPVSAMLNMLKVSSENTQPTKYLTLLRQKLEDNSRMTFFEFSKAQIQARLEANWCRKDARELTRLQHMIDEVGRPQPIEDEFIEKRSKIKKTHTAFKPQIILPEKQPDQARSDREDTCCCCPI